MHPVTKRILGPDNELVSDLQEVFGIESHLWTQPSRWIDPRNLYELLVNILFDDLI